MEKIENKNVYKAAEVRLSYVSDVLPSERIKIQSAGDILVAFFNFWDWGRIEYIEEVKMIMLNQANALLGIANLSSGGTSGAIIDIRIIMQYALSANASAVIIAHNHPSGNLTPSQADIDITRNIKSALELFNIRLLDHLIINSGKEFTSIIDRV